MHVGLKKLAVAWLCLPLSCAAPRAQQDAVSETRDKGDYRMLEASKARDRDAAAFTKQSQQKKKKRRPYQPLESGQSDRQGVIDQPLGPRF